MKSNSITEQNRMQRAIAALFGKDTTYLDQLSARERAVESKKKELDKLLSTLNDRNAELNKRDSKLNRIESDLSKRESHLSERESALSSDFNIPTSNLPQVDIVTRNYIANRAVLLMNEISAFYDTTSSLREGGVALAYADRKKLEKRRDYLMGRFGALIGELRLSQNPNETIVIGNQTLDTIASTVSGHIIEAQKKYQEEYQEEYPSSKQDKEECVRDCPVATGMHTEFLDFLISLESMFGTKGVQPYIPQSWLKSSYGLRQHFSWASNIRSSYSYTMLQPVFNGLSPYKNQKAIDNDTNEFSEPPPMFKEPYYFTDMSGSPIDNLLNDTSYIHKGHDNTDDDAR